MRGRCKEIEIPNCAARVVRELTLADVAVVASCELGRLGTSSVRTKERVVTEAGEVAAEAEAVIVARDPETGRSRPITDAERAGFAR